MKSGILKISKTGEFTLSILLTVSIAVLCFFVSDFIGYRTVALILLFTVSLLAMLVSVYPVLISAALSALIWDFFFIPPHFTFHIEKSEDILMLLMYFIIAFVNGISMYKIRQYEKDALQKEENLKTLKLYSSLYNSLSHELRTPITAILGITETLSDKKSNIKEEDKAQMITEITFAGRRLNRMVDNLLNNSRIESGTLTLKADWCDINELIQNCISRLKEDFITAKIHLQTDQIISLFKIDYFLIEQALYNIISNSFTHNIDGVEVIIEIKENNNFLGITISDTGKGFDPQKIKSIFEKFQYLETQKKGLGLGLSIAQSFIQLHGGSIIAKNNPTGGALFAITLPVEKFKL